MIRDERKDEEPPLNMTPMIDMIFLLIIFFLTATTFVQKEREMDIDLPASRGAGSLSKSIDTSLILNIKQDGSCYVAGRKLAGKELLDFVTERNLRAQSALKVKIRADKRTPHGLVTDIYAIVEKAGVRRLHVDTRQEDSTP